MALDNAEFISELSITDPEGTDPLNQGDDQIRTTKRATQQSFPNINAPVPQTAAQMAQMAIKNEVNLFTQSNTFSAQLGILLDSGGTAQVSIDKAGIRQWQLSYSGTSNNFDIRRFVGGSLQDAPLELNQTTGKMLLAQGMLNANGSTAAPSYAFSTDTGTGMYRDTSSRISFASAGVFKFLIDFTQVQAVVPFVAPNASAAAPGFSFAGDKTSGMFLVAADTLGFAVAGTEALRFNSNREAVFANQVLAVDGIETFPGFAFASDQGTGVYASATSLNLSANGVTIASFTSSSDIFAAEGRSWAGNSLRTAARPAFNFNSDSDTGFYNSAANTIGIATGGASWGTMDSSALWLANGISVHGDGASLVGNPAFAFTNDTDSGFSRNQANVPNIIAGGVEIMTFGTGGVGIRLGTPFFPNLPTSPGFGGSLWNDGGTVKVA